MPDARDRPPLRLARSRTRVVFHLRSSGILALAAAVVGAIAAALDHHAIAWSLLSGAGMYLLLAGASYVHVLWRMRDPDGRIRRKAAEVRDA